MPNLALLKLLHYAYTNIRTYQDKKGDKDLFVVPMDMWVFAVRIKKALKQLRDWDCPATFEVRLGTQRDHQSRAIHHIQQFPMDDPIIILDPLGTFDVNGCNSTLCRTFSKFAQSIRTSRCPPHVMVVNADQLGHRQLVCLHCLLCAMYEQRHRHLLTSIYAGHGTWIRSQGTCR